MSKVLNLKHDPAGRRRVPEKYTPISKTRVKKLLAQEWATFRSQTTNSGTHNKRASKVLPLGVTSSFQHWDPYPISIASAPLAAHARTESTQPGYPPVMYGTKHFPPLSMRARRAASRRPVTSTLSRWTSFGPRPCRHVRKGSSEPSYPACSLLRG